jgi:hypothetical protein
VRRALLNGLARTIELLGEDGSRGDRVHALNDDERAQLLALLRRLAEEQDLQPGVHPGFRRIGRRA